MIKLCKSEYVIGRYAVILSIDVGYLINWHYKKRCYCLMIFWENKNGSAVNLTTKPFSVELTSRFELPNLFITNEVLYLLSYASIKHNKYYIR